MSEKIVIPPIQLIAVDKITVDGKNPNRMSREKLDSLKFSIKKFGFIKPIVTNQNLLIADGEQRWKIAKELEMSTIPAVVLPVKDVDRRLVREVLNLLHGEHDKKGSTSRISSYN
ncbi:MAG TPA: ParB/RepB/Spo0J family partition protein [Candidatus Sulfotelmatobacter sp.]|jgi:ParB-like chromosome segregation protein Spo0J|nr:ParB/RepB/Spo0J family partition protein [Candidatus Sulfotelmatobacter sp.]